MENATTYSIIDPNGICINQVLWDGSSEWTPPNDCIAIPGSYAIGEYTDIVFSDEAISSYIKPIDTFSIPVETSYVEPTE